MHCCGPNLFWDGCNEIQNLGPKIVDYQDILNRNKENTPHFLPGGGASVCGGTRIFWGGQREANF